MPTHKVMITYANPNRLSEILIEISRFVLAPQSHQQACLFPSSPCVPNAGSARYGCLFWYTYEGRVTVMCCLPDRGGATCAACVYTVTYYTFLS